VRYKGESQAICSVEKGIVPGSHASQNWVPLGLDKTKCGLSWVSVVTW
jgi:hypothetical protein